MADNWYFPSKESLFRAYVGTEYGLTPANQVEKIQEIKKQEARNIIGMLSLTKNDITIDLGAGCGFIAKEISEHVSWIYALDISNSFLEYCQLELQGCKNASCHLIKFGDLTQFMNLGVTSVYATALFIHFNIYDVYLHLQALYSCLPPGGRVLLDYLDAEYFDPNVPTFQRHFKNYAADKSNLSICLHYHNNSQISKIAECLGFSIFTLIKGAKPFVLLTKMDR